MWKKLPENGTVKKSLLGPFIYWALAPRKHCFGPRAIKSYIKKERLWARSNMFRHRRGRENPIEIPCNKSFHHDSNHRSKGHDQGHTECSRKVYITYHLHNATLHNMDHDYSCKTKSHKDDRTHHLRKTALDNISHAHLHKEMFHIQI